MSVVVVVKVSVVVRSTGFNNFLGDSVCLERRLRVCLQPSESFLIKINNINITTDNANTTFKLTLIHLAIPCILTKFLSVHLVLLVLRRCGAANDLPTRPEHTCRIDWYSPCCHSSQVCGRFVQDRESGVELPTILLSL